MSIQGKIMRVAACAALAAFIQGCSAWEWAFGGPDPEDMTEILMNRPAFAPAQETSAPPAAERGYPTEWHRGQLLD